MNSEQGGELDVGQDVDPLTGRPPPQQPAQQPAQRPAAPRARFPWKAVIAAALAAAALAVTVITLLRPTPAAIPASAPITTTPADTTAFDRALCTAMAPLMDEINRISWTYEALGEPGTPARDSALPKFISDVQDWIGRVQPILDQHPDARPFFRRSLQRFIDDRNLLVSDLKPGRWPPKAYAMWSDSEGAYSGPLHVCEQVGVKWLR
jgi:hypothetical protein